MQNHLSKPEDLMLQNATLLRTSAPGPPNNSDEHISCIAPATENASLLILFKCPTPAIVFGNATKPSRFARFWQDPQSLAPATRNDIWTSQSGPNPYVFLTLWLRNVLRATTACTFSASQRPKVVRTWCAFNILTSKCASATTACAFSTSQLPKVVHFDFEMCFAPQPRALVRHRNFQSGPNTVCFVHFDFEMCFAPQRRALFRHLNGQKWSGPDVLCTFWLRNVLRATPVCNCSSLIWPAGSAPAALASLLFDHKSLEKTQCVATFVPFRAPASSFCWLFLFSLLLFSSLFFCSASAFLCPYCRKFDF